jgi:hypothetical protein
VERFKGPTQRARKAQRSQRGAGWDASEGNHTNPTF